MIYENLNLKTKELNSEKINRCDWLLIIGLVLAPMTSLRIAKVGPAELLCFIWSIKNFDRKIQMNAISKFFIVFLMALVLGSMYCYIFYPAELDKTGIFTWVYLAFIAIVMYQSLHNNSKEYNEKMFTTFSKIAIVWYLFLYLVSILYSKTPFGVPLWYYGVRFTGGATNPHQIAILMCGLTFVFAKRVIERKETTISLIFALISFYIELQTQASTGLMSMILGLFSMIAVLTIYKCDSNKRKYLIIAVELCAFVILLLLFYNYFYNYVYGWISSDKNGLGRLEIASRIGKAFFKSPLFGLGPGAHSVNDYGGTIEFHNTYLEILAATGIIGAISFITLTAKTLKLLLNNGCLYIPVVVAIYVYGFGGFAMRRLVYWGIFIFILVLAEQLINSTNNNMSANKGDVYV